MGKNTQSQKTGNSTVLREFSAGGIIFKGDKWLVRSTTPSKEFPVSYWMLPKGWIDDAGPGIPGPMASGNIKADEKSLQKTALREVEEEGGVKAKVIKKIGTISYPFKHPIRGMILKFVTFYLMEYIEDTDNGHDWETQEVLWLPYDEAYKRLSFKGEKEILEKAKELQASVA
jgi:8-oxo-dGTP pyrophosphatase MutT (NUDIX family)